MIILTYVPTFSLANDDISNEKIINQLQTYGEGNILEPNTLMRANQTAYNFPSTSWSNQSIYLTRTSSNTGITITANNYGSNYIDVCIFKQGTTEVVGNTKTILPGRVNTLSWDSNALKSDLKVYIYFTMYKNAVNPMQVVITY